jgi:hypothetical protein
MRSFLGSICRSRSHSILGYRFGLIELLVIAWTALFPVAADAQRTDNTSFRLGIGTFLNRDRGWNYGEPIELFAAVRRKAASIDVEAGASFSKSFVGFSKPAVYPPPPSAYLDGFRARLGIRVPDASHSLVSALVGAEFVHNRTEGEARTSTIAGMVGIGFNFGPARRGTLDLRYVSFAKRLGSSRGILPLTLAWQL